MLTTPVENQIPIEALTTLYEEGGADVKLSCMGVAKGFFSNSPETVGVLNSKLSSEESIDDRIEACRVLRGLFISERDADLKDDNGIAKVLHLPEVMEALIQGMLVTLEKNSMDREALVHIRDCFWIFSRTLNRKDYIYLLIEKGLAEFVVKYDRIAIRGGESRNRGDTFTLPTLSSFIEHSSSDVVITDDTVSVVIRSLVYANERCQLNLFDYNSSELSTSFRSMLQDYRNELWGKYCQHKG